MKQRSKLVQKLEINTESEFKKLRAIVPMTTAWETALRKIILHGVPYSSTGFKKQKVYAKLKQIQKRLAL